MESRRNKMLELINREGSVSFAFLKENFPEVSDMTLRRDLESLDQSKQIVRIHGGAKSVDVVIGTDDLYLRRTARNVERKKSIAQKASKLVRRNTAMYIDSGSTCTEFARILPDEPFLIFTNSISVAFELARLSQAQVHMMGGQMNRSSLSLHGGRTISYLNDINFNIAFFGVTGYSSNMGFTVGSEEEYEMKKAIMSRSDKVILLMDSTKVGHASTFTFTLPQDVDVIVSDGQMNPSDVLSFEQHGIKVL